MPRVSDEYLEQRRRQILDAAQRCFARKGFHETSMQDVFRESGLSAGAVYRYFKSKNELVVSAGASVVLLGTLLWFGAELVTGGGQAGLAERLLGGMQTLWPVLVILSCRRRTGPPPDRSGTR